MWHPLIESKWLVTKSYTVSLASAMLLTHRLLQPRFQGFSLFVGGPPPPRRGKSPGNTVEATQTQFL